MRMYSIQEGRSCTGTELPLRRHWMSEARSSAWAFGGLQIVGKSVGIPPCSEQRTHLENTPNPEGSDGRLGRQTLPYEASVLSAEAEVHLETVRFTSRPV